MSFEGVEAASIWASFGPSSDLCGLVFLSQSSCHPIVGDRLQQAFAAHDGLLAIARNRCTANGTIVLRHRGASLVACLPLGRRLRRHPVSDGIDFLDSSQDLP